MICCVIAVIFIYLFSRETFAAGPPFKLFPGNITTPIVSTWSRFAENLPGGPNTKTFGYQPLAPSIDL